MEVLAREDVEVHRVGLVHEVSADVARLDQLDQSITGLVTGTEVHDLRLAVRDHVDVLDQLLGKVVDSLVALDGIRIALGAVEHQVVAPVVAHLMLFLVCS